MSRYTVNLDREGAEWLSQEARDLFISTRDFGWKEIAESLAKQLDLWAAVDDD